VCAAVYCAGSVEESLGGDRCTLARGLIGMGPDGRLSGSQFEPFRHSALPVEVEVDVSAGLPGFSIVGLPDAAVQEARERVRVAISNSGYKFPTKKVIVNLAPAGLRKGIL
jgi:hypothetical protein